MLLILDANILFSALIKNSKAAELILSDKIDFITPEFVIAEFKKYKKDIIEKTHRSDEEFQKFFTILSSRIEIIPSEELKPFIDNAKETCPDNKDVPYFAAALKYKCPILSQDSELKKQDEIKVYNIKELIELLN